MTADPEVWDATRVVAHLRSSPALAKLIDHRSVEVRDMSTGNLNAVFLACDAGGREIFVKQAPRHMRVNPARKLSPDRVLLEADALDYFQQLNPGRPVRVLAVDKQVHAVVLESLAGHLDWRSALNQGIWSEGVSGQLGEFVGRSWVGTHPLVLGAEAHLALIARFANPQLCRLTDTVVFAEPFVPEKPHHFRPSLTDEVHGLWADERAMRSVAVARSRFCTVRGALLHGDLHSGSVMVPAGGSGPARIIDPEFATVGPIGFDLGLVLGSLLTQAARAVALDLPEHRRRLAAAAVELLDAFAATGRAEWERRELPDAVGDVERRDALLDAALMGSCEALRRLIHTAPVQDLEELEDGEYRRAGVWLLATTTALLHEPELLTDRVALRTLLDGSAG